MERITSLINQLLICVRAPNQPMAPLDVQASLSCALRVVKPCFQHDGIMTLIEMPGNLPFVWEAANPLEQMCIKVLVNAWQAMPQGAP